MQVQTYLLFRLVFVNLFLVRMICWICVDNILTISYFPFYRFFIDDVGYEQRAVSELRNKLSLLIGTAFTKSKSVAVQFSAIGALLSLLPLPFDKIVAAQSRPFSGPFVLQASQISEWFDQLSKEHQSLARSFFS